MVFGVPISIYIIWHKFGLTNLKINLTNLFQNMPILLIDKLFNLVDTAVMKPVKGDKGTKGDHGDKGSVGNIGPGGNPVSIN